MKNDNIEELIKSLDFDIAEPSEDHQERFRARLKQKSKRRIKTSGMISLWMPALAIAASFLVAFLLFPGAFGNWMQVEQDLANVSPEMKNTQDFYSSVISKELYNLQQEKSPETEKIINDALRQLEILENDYEKLKADLTTSGQDQRVISAMIANFQKRINLLNNVLKKVSAIKELKTTSYENQLL